MLATTRDRRGRVLLLLGATAALWLLATLAADALTAAPAAAAESAERSFVPISPTRVLDTRNTTHGDLSSPIGPDTTESTTVTGVAGVPASATAVAINVTAVESTRSGYLTIWPTGETRPLAASINFPADATVGNQITAKVGTGGQVDIYNFDGTVDVVFDVVGYYQASRLDELESTVADQAADIADLQSTVADQAAEISALQTLLAGVSRQDDARGRDTLTFAGMNLQVVNDTGSTDGTPNGLGNLIIGYDTERASGSDKSGSHYLVVGDSHNYTAFGGIVAGVRNTAGAEGASAIGGIDNVASGRRATVTGGRDNIANGFSSSVSGGFDNLADANYTSVSGGSSNEATTRRASVSGGQNNEASGDFASVSGGAGNTASGDWSSVLGGSDTTVSTTEACHPGC